MNLDPQQRTRWALFGALALMYAPVLVSLLDGGMWADAEHSHGPIVMAVCLWLMFKRFVPGRPGRHALAAWACLIVGALMYVLGGALGVVYSVVASVIPMLVGLLLLSDGPVTVKALAFPLAFMIFMVPQPGFIVNPVSEFMQLIVSTVTEQLLYAAGYPISRSGVVLQIGQYQLLVAEACAGMRTLFMVEALGILYLNLVKHQSWMRNITLAALIVPISFCANITRVIVLSLITYYWGDEAGQGFLHGFAGMVLFLTALGLTIFADSLLRAASRRSPQTA